MRTISIVAFATIDQNARPIIRIEIVTVRTIASMRAERVVTCMGTTTVLLLTLVHVVAKREFLGINAITLVTFARVGTKDVPAILSTIVLKFRTLVYVQARYVVVQRQTKSRGTVACYVTVQRATNVGTAAVLD